MHIAILGATSQIARDLIESFAHDDRHRLALFARRPQAVIVPAPFQWSRRCTVRSLDAFDTLQSYDAIINFVGVGTPRKTVEAGASILNITEQYDRLALDLLDRNSTCRYIFLSSGVVYGSRFDEPANQDTRASFPINHLGAQDWYGIAKFQSECRHRAMAHLPIVDVRIFNYFSHTQDLEAGFFITDLINAIHNKRPLETSSTPMIRDYIGPQDFHQLVECILAAAPTNLALDCYTRKVIAKHELLEQMRKQFGLSYIFKDEPFTMGTGLKPHYYSLSRAAANLGFRPRYSSEESIVLEMRKLISKTP